MARDPTKETVAVADLDPTAGAELRRMIDGYQVSQAIAVAATLGIPDLLGDRARDSDDLAQATGTHPRSLLRLLRALAAVGVLAADEDRFSLTPLSAWLRTDTTGSLRAWAVQSGQPSTWAAWAHLSHSIESGESAFRDVHHTDAWTYRAQHPTAGKLFDAAMTGSTRQTTAAILAAYEFRETGTVVDVGGGQGALIAAILAAKPGLRGVVFDQAHVVAGAGDLLRDAAVADRCDVVAGDFFDSVPTGGDLYLFKAIVHDWDDDHAARILRTCRRAMHSRARLLLIERILPGDAAPDRAALFMDLQMLVVHGAAERTAQEFTTLLASTGFRLTRVLGTESGLHLIEAVPELDSPAS